MVKLHIKKGDESQFLYDTVTTTDITKLLDEIIPIYNGRLKISRIASEMEELASVGITLPPNMQGLTDEQIDELHLVDKWATSCSPSGGHSFNADKLGRRNGFAPKPNMAEVLRKTLQEAKDKVSKKLVVGNVCLSLEDVREALNVMRGAVMIVYPMGLPEHDPIRSEFDNVEDLSGQQASLDVLPLEKSSLWWAGKEMLRGKPLGDYVGKNEKTKIICKLQKMGQGPPGREAVVGDEEKKNMMAYYYKKQEEMKKLDAEADDSYMDSKWADNGALKRQFQGLNNIKWGGPGGK